MLYDVQSYLLLYFVSFHEILPFIDKIYFILFIYFFLLTIGLY